MIAPPVRIPEYHRSARAVLALLCIGVLLPISGCGNKGDLYLEPDAALEQQLEEVDRAIDTLQGPDIDDSLDALEREEADAEAAAAAQKDADARKDKSTPTTGN